MEPNQNSSLAPQPTDESDADATAKMLTLQHQAWIDYTALNGLITDITSDAVDDDGNQFTLRRMPITEFAKRLGVDRGTLRNWRMSIPNFWGRVADRRKELSGQSRLAKVHDVMYQSSLQKGAKGFRDRMLYLANFDPNFRMPTEKVEHSVAQSWAGLAAAKRQRDSGVIEGEIVPDKDTP